MLSNSYSRVLVLVGYPLQTNVNVTIYPLSGGSGFVSQCSRTQIDSYSMKIVQFSYSSIRYKVSGITGSLSVWTGTNTGTVTFQTLGWTATRFPPRVVVPSQHSAFAVDSRYATRSTSSLIVNTAASYSNFEHGLNLLADFPVLVFESVRFFTKCTLTGAGGYSKLELTSLVTLSCD